jgi:hypothetical protein
MYGGVASLSRGIPSASMFNELWVLNTETAEWSLPTTIGGPTYDRLTLQLILHLLCVGSSPNKCSFVVVQTLVEGPHMQLLYGMMDFSFMVW